MFPALAVVNSFLLESQNPILKSSAVDTVGAGERPATIDALNTFPALAETNALVYHVAKEYGIIDNIITKK